jgi:glycosyltransferase involved in cell wall biosynthesis
LLNITEHDMELLRNSAAFDPDWYAAYYKDVIIGGFDPAFHYLWLGWKLGRRPSERMNIIIDADDYLSVNPDVATSRMHPVAHYLAYGMGERRRIGKSEYPNWIKAYDTISDSDIVKMRSVSAQFAIKPLISVIMPTYNTSRDILVDAIESVRQQAYPNWELCIADDCSSNTETKDVLRHYTKKDVRISVTYRPENGHISTASNSALDLATGDYIALLDHDDLLSKNALFWVVEAINRFPNADLIYSDEDKINKFGDRYDPNFKCDFNYELFLSQNMVSHLGVYRRSIVSDIGGFRAGFEGAQDHDLALRFIERIPFENIVHVPRILYHWRAVEGSTAVDISGKNYAKQAAMRSLDEHLARSNRPAKIYESLEMEGQYRVRFQLRNVNHVVSIIIPTRDKVDLLKTCVNSILDKSTYENYEIIIVDNGSEEKETLDYFNKISSKKIRVIRDDLPFNYPRVNNIAVEVAAGDYICLMNNDIEIITPDWIEEMLSFSQNDEVGCVGARLWYPDRTLQHGGVIVSLGGVAGHSHKHVASGHLGYFGRAVLHQALSAVTAACLMVKKSIYLEVGGLDEDLAVAFNDVDFCLRVRHAGYRNVWTPYAEMFHHESASRGAETTPGKIARFNKEIAFMKSRWGKELSYDPYYSPNLTLDREDFSIAFPPRVPNIEDLVISIE